MLVLGMRVIFADVIREEAFGRLLALDASRRVDEFQVWMRQATVVWW